MNHTGEKTLNPYLGLKLILNFNLIVILF